jgi:tetratricopeptide (TPR) repeat protein
LDFYRNYALKHQARVLKEMGRTEDAIEALEELLDSEPSTFLENYAEGELKVLRS